MIETDWQTSWDTFVDVLSAQVQSGKTDRELKIFFGGYYVRWQGVVEDLQLDELAPSVGVTMHFRELLFNDGRIASLGGLFLPLANQSLSLWKEVKVGKDISFTARFLNAESIFPPIEIKKLRSGRILVMVRLVEASPVFKSES